MKTAAATVRAKKVKPAKKKSPKALKQAKVKLIFVGLDASGMPTVDVHRCPLSKKRLEVVVWVTNCDSAFDIRFNKNGTPFAQNYFPLPAQGAVAAGPATAAAGTQFDYGITSQATGQTLDPQMIVNA